MLVLLQFGLEFVGKLNFNIVKKAKFQYNTPYSGILDEPIYAQINIFFDATAVRDTTIAFILTPDNMIY